MKTYKEERKRGQEEEYKRDGSESQMRAISKKGEQRKKGYLQI